MSCITECILEKKKKKKRKTFQQTAKDGGTAGGVLSVSGTSSDGNREALLTWRQVPRGVYQRLAGCDDAVMMTTSVQTKPLNLLSYTTSTQYNTARFSGKVSTVLQLHLVVKSGDTVGSPTSGSTRRSDDRENTAVYGHLLITWPTKQDPQTIITTGRTGRQWCRDHEPV